jgi:fructose-specific component phosphotransferase system IIB-like protein
MLRTDSMHVELGGTGTSQARKMGCSAASHASLEIIENTSACRNELGAARALVAHSLLRACVVHKTDNL